MAERQRVSVPVHRVVTDTSAIRYAVSLPMNDFEALRVNVGFGVAGTGWRVMLSGVLGLGSWWGW